MSRGLVALASSAITAIYAVGYLQTQPADTSLGAQVESAQPTQTPTAVLVAAPPPTTPAPSRPLPTATGATTGYKDGVYSGLGTSRRGSVQVQVSVQGGRIASVDITRVTTQYPVRDIAGLPAQVVQRQSPSVDVVSGATFSAIAFRSAVQQALQQAQA